MQENHDTKQDAVELLAEVLLYAIGPNASYPTPEEITAHKRLAEQRLKYQNLTFADHATQ